MTVFVSVASYRNPELVPTVLDCLAKSGQPDEVRVVVCWQHRGDEDVSAIAADPRVELLDVDACDSRGACWAHATGAAKPVITCYPSTYDPATEFTGADVPSETVVGGWTNDADNRPVRCRAGAHACGLRGLLRM